MARFVPVLRHERCKLCRFERGSTYREAVRRATARGECVRKPDGAFRASLGERMITSRCGCGAVRTVKGTMIGVATRNRKRDNSVDLLAFLVDAVPTGQARVKGLDYRMFR